MQHYPSGSVALELGAQPSSVSDVSYKARLNSDAMRQLLKAVVLNAMKNLF
jgi:hypothetical protein